MVLDFTAAFIYTSPTILSWPYTIIFALQNFYGGSNVFGVFAWFLGQQVIFFLSKIVNKKRVHHLPVFGFTSVPVYAVCLDISGLMDFRAFMIATIIPLSINIISTYIVGRVLWVIFRRIKLVE